MTQRKAAALMAYHSGQLSEKGRQRVERHLKHSDEARQTLAAIQAYEDLLADAQRESTPAPDWSKLDPPLQLEAQRLARSVRSERFVVPSLTAGALLAAAAVMAVFYGNRSSSHESPRTERSAHPSAAAQETGSASVPLNGEVTATAGSVVEGTRRSGSNALGVGAPVTEGMDLSTGHASQAHVRLDEGRGLVLLAETHVRLPRLREDEIEVELTQGSVAQSVAPAPPGSSAPGLRVSPPPDRRYDIRSGAWTVKVRGTQFSVHREQAALSVSVRSGTVEVYRSDRLVRRLRAPARWSSNRRGPPVAPDPAQVRLPVGLEGDATTWPVFRIAATEGVSHWRIGGEDFPGGGALAMRVPVGHLDVLGFAGDKVVLRTVVAVLPDGAFLEPGPLRPSAPMVRVGTLAPDLIAPVVEAGRRRMRRCKERLDRVGDGVYGRFRLQLSIGHAGEVLAAALEAERAHPPAAFEACILSEARSWVFPPPSGGVVHVAVPLVFSTRMR